VKISRIASCIAQTSNLNSRAAVTEEAHARTPEYCPR
jgi:hypothetical protein